jgi:outer membrane lipoprotein SlyB
MMPAHQLVVAAVAALAAFVAAAQTQAPPGPADAGDCERCGKIESIHPVTTKDTWTPLGSVSSSPAAAVGGGAAGTSPSAITMFQIGPGFSKQGTVMLGAAGGAAYQTRPSQLNAKRWEIIVRMDAGGTRAVTQNYEPMLREGDRVRVMGTQLELLP